MPCFACGSYYLTGDGCRRDADGCYWLTGRIDDVINVSGHRIGTAEVESAVVLDHRVRGRNVVWVGCARPLSNARGAAMGRSGE